MRRLDRRDARLRTRGVALDARVRRQQALLDQQIDQRRRLRRDVRAARDVATRRLALRVYPCKPGDQSAPQQRKPRLAILGNARVRVGAHERPRHGRVDRAFEATEFLVVGEPQLSPFAVVEVQLLERESEQRQRVGAAAGLDVGERAFRQSGFNGEPAARVLQPSRRPLDHFGVGTARHRQERQRRLRHAFQRLCALQRVIGVGTDREDRDHRGIVAADEFAENRKQRLAFLFALDAEQLLRLIDGDHRRRRPLRLVADHAPRKRGLHELGEQGPEGDRSPPRRLA